MRSNTTETAVAVVAVAEESREQGDELLDACLIIDQRAKKQQTTKQNSAPAGTKDLQ
jgi:hypothetical protein